MKEWQNVYLSNTHQKTAGVAILILDEIYFRASNIARNKEGDFIMIRGPYIKEHNSPKC